MADLCACQRPGIEAAIKVAAWHRWSDSGIEEYKQAHDDICAALKEQS